jgi:hypothetical protein
VQQAVHILSNLTAPNLEQVSFEFSLPEVRRRMERANWRRVDQILGSEKFGSLRRVQITFNELTKCPSDLEMIQFCQNLTDNFPLVMSRETVKVETRFFFEFCGFLYNYL